MCSVTITCVVYVLCVIERRSAGNRLHGVRE